MTPDPDGAGAGPIEGPEPDEDLERRAVDVALNFLSYRQRTGHEVRRKLSDSGFSEATVEAALRRLRAVGLVDDEAFVAAYVRDRIAHRPMGVRRMVQELYLKGIPREVAAPVIEQVLRDECTDERTLAERVAARKVGGRSGEHRDPAVLRKRVRDHLLRRGFDPRIVRDVVDAVLPARGRATDG